MQNNAEISVKDNYGIPISTATVQVNGTTLSYIPGRGTYNGYIASTVGAAVTITVTINGISYSVPAATTQCATATAPTLTGPAGAIVSGNTISAASAGGMATGSALFGCAAVASLPAIPAGNYGSISFNTLSVSLYITNATSWNNYIPPSFLAVSAPLSVVGTPGVVLYIYANKTIPINYAAATQVGSIDVGIAGSPIAVNVVP